jgi:hypothetical protein
MLTYIRLAEFEHVGTSSDSYGGRPDGDLVGQTPPGPKLALQEAVFLHQVGDRRSLPGRSANR